MFHRLGITCLRDPFGKLNNPNIIYIAYIVFFKTIMKYYLQAWNSKFWFVNVPYSNRSNDSDLSSGGAERRTVNREPKDK